MALGAPAASHIHFPASPPVRALLSGGLQVPIKCVEGQLYVRLSAHIYNDLPQYARLAEVVAAAIR